MTSGLTEHQREALDRYDVLRTRHPELFAPRTLRPIIEERAVLESYAAEQGTVLGVAAETPWFLFVVDLVRPFNSVSAYPYSRLINKRQMEGGTNIAVLATIADASLGNLGEIILVEQERHATGRSEVAVPRGFGETGHDGAAVALRELLEETGYTGAGAEFLGESIIDSGMGDARVNFYRVRVDARIDAAPEYTEAIHAVRLISSAELWAAIRRGEITDSFTLQALALAGDCGN